MCSLNSNACTYFLFQESLHDLFKWTNATNSEKLPEIVMIILIIMLQVYNVYKSGYYIQKLNLQWHIYKWKKKLKILCKVIKKNKTS